MAFSFYDGKGISGIQLLLAVTRNERALLLSTFLTFLVKGYTIFQDGTETVPFTNHGRRHAPPFIPFMTASESIKVEQDEKE